MFRQPRFRSYCHSFQIKAPEVFDAVHCLIATHWHMRNPHKNYNCEYTALMEYHNRPDKQQYSIVVVSLNKPKPTASQRVRLGRQDAGFYTSLDDVPDSKFFNYNPAGLSDEEKEVEDHEVVEEPMLKRRKVQGGYC